MRYSDDLHRRESVEREWSCARGILEERGGFGLVSYKQFGVVSSRRLPSSIRGEEERETGMTADSGFVRL